MVSQAGSSVPLAAKLELLGMVPALQQLGDSETRALASTLEPFSFEAKKAIISQGDAAGPCARALADYLPMYISVTHG